MLRKITFEVETITPMFLSGADQSKAELRAASIKGLLRFWWRAIKAETDPRVLLREESEIFGAPDERVGGAKFSIRIIVSNPKNNEEYAPLPHSQTKRFKFKCVPAGQRFSLLLSSRYDIEKFKDILESALLLGGLGRRSRRGFGSVHCTDWNFNTTEELQELMLDRLNHIQCMFDRNDSRIYRKSTPPANYPYIKEIIFGSATKDMKSILKKIGQTSHDNCDPSLGYAGRYAGSPCRMASPIYVHIVKLKENYIPIVTTLNSIFPAKYPNINLRKQADFVATLYHRRELI